MIGTDLSESDYESGVLSCCLRDLSWPTAYGRASELISPKHFSDSNKAKVFEVMGGLTEPPDEMVLADKSGIPIGDIIGMTGRTDTSTYIQTFTEGVLKCWTIRQANYIGMELMDGIKQSEEPNDILSSASKRITDTLSQQGSAFVPVDEGLDQTLQECYDLDEGKVELLTTGLTDLDRILGGFKKGEMSILSARPSNGKTALALSIAARIASRGKRVLFSSLEMSLEQLRKRLIHSEARVPIINKPNHYTSTDREKLREAVERIKGWPLKIDQACGITVPYLTAKAMAEKTRSGLDLLVVDYLGIMNGTGKDLYERMTEISKGMQQLAKKLEVPVLALSQQNRDSEKDANPSMRHLRDSGSLEQDADQIIMLKRLSVGEFLPTEVMEAWVVKNRNGCTGKTPLTFSRSYARYDNTASEPQPNRLN